MFFHFFFLDLSFQLEALCALETTQPVLTRFDRLAKGDISLAPLFLIPS